MSPITVCDSVISPPCSHALKCAKQDQLPHALGQTAQERGTQEGANAKRQQWAAAEHVGQLAIHRCRDGGSKHERRHYP